MDQLFTTMAQTLMVMPESLHKDETALAYFMSDIAQRFVDQDKDDEDETVYLPPALDWIIDQLEDLKGKRDKEKGSRPVRAGRRSRKALSATLVGDTDSESGGTSGTRTALNRLDAKARHEKRERKEWEDRARMMDAYSYNHSLDDRETGEIDDGSAAGPQGAGEEDRLSWLWLL